MSETILEFAIKAAILAALLVVAAWIATRMAKAALTEQFDRIERIVRLDGMDHRAIDRVDKLIIRISQADLSEQRQKQILHHIKFAAEKWRPFLDKVWRAIEKPEQNREATII